MKFSIFKSFSFPVTGLLIVTGIIYLWTQNPYVDFGDSLGFLQSALNGFDWNTNASSHLLYVNSCHIILLLFPFLDPVLIMGTFSVVFGLISLGLLFRLLRSLTASAEASLLATAFFAVSFTWWRQTVIIEVYTFHICLFLVVLSYLFKDWDIPNRKNAFWASFWLGTAIWAHIQHILLLPLLVVCLILKQKGATINRLFPLVLFLVFLSALVVLPLITHLHPVSAVFFDNRSQGEIMGVDIPNMITGGGKSLVYWLYNFHLFIPFMVHGLWLCWKKKRKIFWTLGLGIIFPYWGFAMRFAVSDNYVFFLAPYIAWIIFGGMSLSWWFEKKVWRNGTLWLWIIPVILSPVVYSASLHLATQSEKAKVWATPKAYKGGLSYYLWPGRSMAPDPLFLAKEIHMNNIDPIPDFERHQQAWEIVILLEERTNEK